MYEFTNDVRETYAKLCERVRAERRMAGMTQGELGETTGMRQSVISKVERGLVNTSVGTMLALLSPFGKTLAVVDTAEEPE